MATLITIGLVGILALGLFLYEKKKMNTHEIALIASLGAFAGVSRIPFAALPNIQPTTFLVIISGMVLGPLNGFMVGIIAALVSNSFLGHGPYTIWQMLAWGLAGGISGLIFYQKSLPAKPVLAAYCFLWGFLFDYIMNAWHFLNFVYPHTWQTFIALYGASLFHDMAHGISNAAFAFVFGKDLHLILKRYENRLNGVHYEG
ncbi:MAG: ECF transporter S component [Clostridia bacterium]|nr:ECF transporter S component [Clostridia bacterium]